MTAAQLKASILQLAVSGKLVPQDPKDEPASVLLERIQAEKAKLVKEGKIKKEKPQAPVGDDDVPFELPSGWEWCRIGELFQHCNGKQLNRADTDGELRKYITTSNLYWDRFELDDLRKMLFTDVELVRCSATQGDLLVCEGGDVGRSAIWNEKYDICLQNHIHRLRPYVVLAVRFYLYVMMYLKLSGQIGGKGISIQGLSSSALHAIVVPLPPLAEQHRIVAKVDELLPLVDRYASLEDKRLKLEADLPGALRKSILQQAIEGKLTDRDPKDEPASELLKRIADDKAKLVKEGKLKKEKPLPPIADEEKPFDLPEGWEWCRLGSLVEQITSGSREWAKYYSADGDVFLRMGNLSRGSFELRLDNVQHVRLPNGTEGSRTSLVAGDLLFSITADIGLLGLIPENFGTAYINQHTAMIRFLKECKGRFLPYVLLADYLQEYYGKKGHGVKNSFRLDTLSLLPIPLPPLAEQKRIVAKVESLLADIDRLKK